MRNSIVTNVTVNTEYITNFTNLREKFATTF